MTTQKPTATERQDSASSADEALSPALTGGAEPAADGGTSLKEAPDWPDEPPSERATSAPPLLPGRLSLPGQARALIILAATDAMFSQELLQLAGALNAAGMATVIEEVLTPDEARFANLHHNTPLLTQRLLDLLALIEQRYVEGGLPVLPIGIYAVGDVSPAAVRAAAQRDRDVGALVCRSGMIDLAGLLYLRTLAAPLLHIVGEQAESQRPARRALARVEAPNELCPLADGDAQTLPATAFAALTSLTLGWFISHLQQPGQQPS
ncbi:hypothetical protein [Rhodocyclus tenuis]|uniref:hypothetical protein n=1 Tax=Rhodocyclus tenuis TaxID=1066 RepID=UPI0019080209|nr:hypothetical protein [Rhodocyclus tenuis]MBK1679198.1 hypothetical protein [Rhodocyclus tenuis]